MNNIAKYIGAVLLLAACCPAIAAEASRDVLPAAQGQLPKVFKNSIGAELVLIQPGKFVMGSPESESGHKGNETQHSVILTRHFYIGAYEVTQEQWQAIMGSNPSYSKGDQLPVEMVSWNDCQEFCKRATKKDLDAKRIPEGWKYRLPTEAEQEYACRAGTTTPFHYGETLDSTQANIDGEKTLPVGSFKPNAWGLYDMHGNVYEWCQDYWSGYPTDEATDPVPTTPHPRRVYRGGAWKFNAATARSAKRSQRDPAKAFDFMGLRLVLTNNQ